MADIMPKLTIPTGFESQQRQLELRQRLADALLQSGMTQQGRYGSPLQVLGQMLQGAAGMHMENKVAKDYGGLDQQILSAYHTAHDSFDQDVKNGMSAQALRSKYGDNPYVQDDLKPYDEAFTKSLTGREDIVHTPTGYQRAGDVVGQQEFDPQKDLVPDGHGGFTTNKAKINFALSAQGLNIPQGGSVSYPDTISPPSSSVQPATTAMPPAAGAPSSSSGGIDTSVLTPEERAILVQEIQRRKGLSGGAQAFHGPTGTTPPPSKILGGKPYWNVGGQWYDNPEGN